MRRRVQTREEFIRMFDALGDRDDVRVAILTGVGDMFSAGADIKERVDLVHEPGDYPRHNRTCANSSMPRATVRNR